MPAPRLSVGPIVLPAARFYAAAALAVASLVTPACLAGPGDDAAGAPIEIESAKNSFPGIVNSNAVYVRSGPAESYYPTLKLDKGARLTVVGMKLDWLKIVPPDGSFCYISKAFVDRTGDGSLGKVNKDSVNVRAGSTLNSLKVVPLAQLSVGMEVKILGEQDEYFKIAPPEGKAFVYINKQFVDPDPEAKPKAIEPTKAPAGPVVAQGGAPKPAGPVGPIVPPTTPTTPTAPTAGQPDGTGPIVTTTPDKMQPRDKPTEPTEPPPGANEPITLTQPTTRPAGDGVAAAPTSKPAEDAAAVESQFEKAEVEFAAADKLPLDQQPVADLTKRYEALVASETLTNTLHRIAETRLATLRTRGDAATKLTAAKSAQEEMRKRQQSLVAERQELEQKLQTVGVSSYTAVGELQASSLQLGNKTLYRLTDPANGRTVCYLRSDDGKLVAYMGKFIGVKGEMTTEAQLSLKVVTPTDVAAVDPAKVNHGVTANVIPPSMIAGPEASTAGHEQQP